MSTCNRRNGSHIKDILYKSQTAKLPLDNSMICHYPLCWRFVFASFSEDHSAQSNCQWRRNYSIWALMLTFEVLPCSPHVQPFRKEYCHQWKWLSKWLCSKWLSKWLWSFQTLLIALWTVNSLPTFLAFYTCLVTLGFGNWIIMQ